MHEWCYRSSKRTTGTILLRRGGARRRSMGPGVRRTAPQTDRQNTSWTTTPFLSMENEAHLFALKQIHKIWKFSTSRTRIGFGYDLGYMFIHTWILYVYRYVMGKLLYVLNLNQGHFGRCSFAKPPLQTGSLFPIICPNMNVWVIIRKNMSNPLQVI